MRSRLRTVLTALSLATLLTTAGPGASHAVDPEDTRLLAEPALSATRVAFSYADDLWVADRRPEGSLVGRQLTTHAGRESRPRFSPDGSRLAFSAEYDGNVDVYLMPAGGGAPKRLTYHPGDDRVLGFTHDGSSVLFLSARAVYTRRHEQIFQVSVDGGMPDRLPIPHASAAALSPDGTHLVYQPQGNAFEQWKNYRGGTTARLWILDLADLSVEEIPRPEGGANDTSPQWVGDSIYFRSDRDGAFNLYRFDLATKTVEPLTDYDDFPVLDLAASGATNELIYERAGYLHLFDLATSASRRLRIAVAAELTERRPRWEGGFGEVRSGDLSPSGSRAVLELRGEIVTVPAKKGDPRNLSQSPGANDRSPIWSPKGDRIAWFSDRSGEYELVVSPQDGAGEIESFPLGGAGFYESPRWSPDGEKISYTDNSRSLYWIDLGSGMVTKVSSETMYGPVNTLHHAWSPNSQWLAYTRNTRTYHQQVFLYELTSGNSHSVTEGLADVGEPVFDVSGKYLYFLASTDAGPVRTWFAQSGQDMELSSHLYLAVLAKGEPSPLRRGSDEEESKPGASEEAKDGKAETETETDDDAPLVIDFDGLHERILDLPLPAASRHLLTPGAEGQIYYLETDGATLFGRPPGRLMRFDLATRKAETLAEGINDFRLASGLGKLLLRRPEGLALTEAGKSEPGAGTLDLSGVEVKIDPVAEWKQIFHEAWRINRDYFYDPGMHGADWPAMREKYAPFLAHLSSRNDLTRVIRWMCSELAVGHHRTGGGDQLEDPESIPGGLLGADFEVHEGRYRISKVYGGLSWNPDLRSPLTEPGVEVEAGSYLLAVEGEDVRPPANLHRFFENTAGKNVEITVGPHPDGEDGRTVTVVPLDNELALRNRDWVEGNLRRVDEATGGRVAYVHVPDTATQGHTYFKRYFFPQAHKEAIIVDERHNGGGLVADYYIDILRRPVISRWAMRYGEDLETPLGAIQGPKVMLIDETAGSGGDLLPWMFRRFELGTLVGKRTWGGLVGILGFPSLLDGGFITAPNLAFYSEGGFRVENEGVPPDVEVEQWPAAIAEGRDPQLERAIEIALEALESHTDPEIPRPDYPVRVRR